MSRKRKKYTGVYPRGNNSYRISYYVSGKRKYETVEAQSEGEAFAIRLQRLTAVSDKSQKTVSIDDITLEGAFQHYLKKEVLLDEVTRQRSTCIYNHLVRYIKLNYHKNY